MNSIAAMIARCEAHLRFIPLAGLKQMRVLALLNQATDSELAMLSWNDDLARDRRTTIWPVSPWRVRKMPVLGPAYNALSLFNELYEATWDVRPHTAVAVPESTYLNSLLYRLVLREMDRRHMALYFFPRTAEGNQLILSLSRPHAGGQPYAPGDLRAMDRVCAAFAPVLQMAPPGPHAARHATPEEHVIELDAELRPRTIPIYLRALFALFYSEISPAADGGEGLPRELEDEIRRNRDAYVSSFQSVAGGFAHAFTKARSGRMLCLQVQSRPDGSSCLVVSEDVSQHARLRRIHAACRALPRDRTSIFSACLVVAEGVQEPAQIARRAGFGALQPSAAARLVARARHIVAEA